VVKTPLPFRFKIVATFISFPFRRQLTHSGPSRASPSLGVERQSASRLSALSREALKGPFPKLNWIGHAISGKRDELLT